uniref:Ribonuclease P/MRP protein subunit POP5 n=1 Tax=Parastrongyloides trichosuri TaxID=131310 RepID=A0A0N4ZUM4_PARTI
MVKLKHRYFLIEACFETTYEKITQYDIINAIKDQVLQLYGDFGLGTMNSSFALSVSELGKGLVVLKVGIESSNYLKGCIPFITKVGKASCILRLLLETASMRSIDKHLVKISLNQLYDSLKKATTIKEKNEIQDAIIKVSGSNAERVRF